MDVSPKWWSKGKKDYGFLKNYVYEKFEVDYYPREMDFRGQKIDLDYSKMPLKKLILDKLEFGEFSCQFIPEDEDIKESYLISDGHVSYNPRKTKMNSRLRITLQIETKQLEQKLLGV